MRWVGLALLLLFLLGVASAEDSVVGEAAPGDVMVDGDVALDADNDGILDAYDQCPGTTDKVIDHSDHLEYAGCSCEQVISLFPDDNPCVKPVCIGTNLNFVEKAYQGVFVDCPPDTCDGFTFYDYPSDGYSKCVDGEVREYHCDPWVSENDVRCGYVAPPPIDNASVGGADSAGDGGGDAPPDADDAPVIPELPGDAQLYYLTDAELSFAYPKEVVEGEDASLRLVILLSGIGATVIPSLSVDGTEILMVEDYCGVDAEGLLFCTALWRLPWRVGSHDLSLGLHYEPGDGSLVEETFTLPFIVRQSPFEPAIVPESSVVLAEDGSLSSREESFLMAVHDELENRGLASPDDLEQFVDGVSESSSNLLVDKNCSYDSFANRTVVAITVSPMKGLVARGVRILEFVPKDFASSADEIIFSVPPTEVVNDDPLIMWEFALVEEPVTVGYEVPGEQAVTGNTVVVAEEMEPLVTPWHVAAPMLVIPFIVLLFLILPRAGRRRH
ncbi:hypothetical protein JXA12_02435 [Candidatus Woesearchaeota archaeon]|nr:hypothetical protein [Candidatus Woesearchaeota archaeon]